MHRASEIAELTPWPNPPDLGNANIKKALRNAWKRKFGDVCPSCGCRMHFEMRFCRHRHYATIDHILARGLGGNDKLENLQVVCRSCNNRKSLDEYHLTEGC